MSDLSVGARYSPAFVWTGTQLLVWGGHGCTGDLGTYCANGGAYTPATDTWRLLSSTAAPSLRRGESAVWTGKAMIVWGGASMPDSTALRDGSAYDPGTDHWSPIDTTTAPSARGAHMAVWSGTEMIVWGGGDNNGLLQDGASYDPVSDRWHTINAAGAPTPRTGANVVWTGAEMIVWGGIDRTSKLVRNGAAYNPATDRWREISCEGPNSTQLPSAVWTGSQMILWDGSTGAIYDPQIDDWTAMSHESAPSPRWRSVAVWTGSEMILWGGESDSDPVISMTDGGRFAP